MANYKLFPYTRITLSGLIALLLTACSSTSKIENTNDGNYGSFPENHQMLINDYLEANPPGIPLDLSTIRFLNSPDKFTYSRFGREDQSGYRVCAQVTTANGRKIKSHFFLIQNQKIVQHLHDLGLLSLSDDYCDIQKLTTSGTGASARSKAPASSIVDEKQIKYISCNLGGKNKFFVFDPEQKQLHEEYDGRTIASYQIEQLSQTFITAIDNNDARISINRITGSGFYQNNGDKSEGNCELLDKQKF